MLNLVNMHYLELLCAFITVAVFIEGASAQITQEAAKERLCQVYDTCDTCIQSEGYCSWCYQKEFNKDRCNTKNALLKNGCTANDIFVNDGFNSTIIKSPDDSDKDFQDVTKPDDLEQSVQIRPQKTTIKLHPKQPLNMQLKYRLAKNYPLDLYYLMDLTKTMENDLSTMTTLGVELIGALQNLTQHYRVAFGYYSDKVAMPFAKMAKNYLENPCITSGTTCRKGFDFVHSLSFTDDINDFIDKIRASRTTANLDNLEGGLDALQQIILCEAQVDWRRNSRKIIVIATDGILHSAGDGILAGAVKRNVDTCMLNENGVYDNSLIYDYPSLEEIYHMLLKHKMNVIFAAKENAISYYNKLNQVIPSVSYVGTLAENSTNVVQLVKDGYLDVVKNVEFLASKSDHLRITWNSSNKLDNVETGQEYFFNFTIEITQLPKDIDRETLVIEEKNINEKMLIEVEYIGRCKNCNANDQNSQTASCSNHGAYICGVCECEEGWKGSTCDRNCLDQHFEECRQKNETYTSSTCHGRGDCECGKCLCDEEYTGKYCEEKQCTKSIDGRVCGGLNHGTCLDGKCKCSEHYTGPDCTCSKLTSTCKAPGSNAICSKSGKCECGKCKCDKNYSGDYCELCDDCKGLCGTYEPCVLDTVSNVTTSTNCITSDGDIYIAKIVDQSMADDPTVCLLRHEEEDGRVCYARYKYKITKGYVELLIHYECTEALHAGALFGIIVAAILGIGILAILVRKAKIMHDDRVEYARFREQVENTKMLEENPLYNSPIRTYTMPAQAEESSN